MHRSKGSEGDLKEPMITLLRVTALKGNISLMKVVEDFDSRPHKAVSFVVEKKEVQEWNEQKLPKVLPGYNQGRLPGRCTEEAGRENEKAEEHCGERRIRNEIAQEVVAGIKEKASAHEDAKSTAQRTAGQSVLQNWDCSQIEDEEEEEEEDWQKEDQVEVHGKLEEILERRRMEGSFLQAEVTQKVP